MSMHPLQPGSGELPDGVKPARYTNPVGSLGFDARSGDFRLPTPRPPHQPLLQRAEVWLAMACSHHLTEDTIQYGASIYPLPTDTGWEPSVFLYVMLPGFGDVPGVHMGQFETPYGLSQELIDSYVKDFADRTANERQALRQAREQGASQAQGLSVGQQPV